MQKIQCLLKDGLLSRISCGDETKLVVTLLISALSALSLCCHLPSGSSSSDSSLKKMFRYNSNGLKSWIIHAVWQHRVYYMLILLWVETHNRGQNHR